MQDVIEYSQEVLEAKKLGRIILAYESAFFSYDIPWPANYKTIQDLKQLLDPFNISIAIIAIKEGKIQIGCADDFLKVICQNKQDKPFEIADRRDLSFFLSQRLSALTNLQASIHCAWLAGIDYIVSSSIGQTGPQASQCFWLEALLKALALCPVQLICAGTKSLVDMPKAAKMLKTHHITSIAYNKEPTIKPYREETRPYLHSLDQVEAIARLIKTQKLLELPNGMLIINNVSNRIELTRQELDTGIQEARKQFSPQKGNTLESFVQKKLAQTIKLKQIQINIDLIKKNSLLTAEICNATFN